MLFKNKKLAIGLLTTNQAVGGSTPSGRAIIAGKSTGYGALSGRFFYGCPIDTYLSNRIRFSYLFSRAESGLACADTHAG